AWRPSSTAATSGTTRSLTCPPTTRTWTARSRPSARRWRATSWSCGSRTTSPSRTATCCCASIPGTSRPGASRRGPPLPPLRRRMTQPEREVQQAEAELGARIHAVDLARQRVAEARAALALAESQIHQVAIKDAEASRAEARLREAQADLAFAELQLEHTEVRA